jgi:D-alanyl-D-alanine carboxypeptidase/D-alanyl-D-alanine-endopeptidase (penicillin-binding protein 4)
MDPGERRRTTPRARRLIALGVLNVLALAALAWVLAGGGTPRAAAPSGAQAELIALDAPDADEGAQGTTAASPPAGEAGARPAAPSYDAALQARVAAVIARARAEAEQRSKGRARAAACTVAVHVVDLASGAQKVAIRSREALRPASNLKLVTAAAALALLGTGHDLETPFEAGGPVAAGELRGDLVARAAGDALYARDGDGSLDPWLDALALELRAAGVERVSGQLVLDEGSFPAPAPGPEWPSESEHWKEYCALAGGFSANAGCVTAHVLPGPVGGRAEVRVRPRAHGLERKGTVTTKAARSRLDVRVEARTHGLTVRGSFPADVPDWSTRFAHPDPVELFGHAVVAGLARRGLTVAGGFRRERGAPGGPRLAALRSPLVSTLVPMLLDSNNSVSDQVFLATALASGLPADRVGGRAAVARALETLGVSAAGLEQVDGSGLSRANRVSARQLTALVAAVLDRGGAEALLVRDALPVAGESGKLGGRMRGTPAAGRVRAKTGFIGGTSALSGIAETLDGRTLVFSILVNYPVVDGLNSAVFKPMQDEICALLVQSEGP